MIVKGALLGDARVIPVDAFGVSGTCGALRAGITFILATQSSFDSTQRSLFKETSTL